MAIQRDLLVLLGLCASSPAWAQQAGPPCAGRFQSAFSEMAQKAQQAQRKDAAAVTWANNEVGLLFGPPQAVCEPGAYQVFLDNYQELARQAIRASGKGQNNLIYLITAAAGRIPLRVPAADMRTAVPAFQQVRTVLYAVADDVKSTPQIKQLLEVFDHSGPPQADMSPPPPLPVQLAPVQVAPLPPQVTPAPPQVAPMPQPQGVPGPGSPPPLTVQQVRVPQTALPPWAVVSLYEARELMRARDTSGAQTKLDLVLRWLESAP
jgi:hypothetical protein